MNYESEHLNLYFVYLRYKSLSVTATPSVIKYSPNCEALHFVN